MAVHTSFMKNELTLRKLALAKNAARIVRIRNIRRRVAYSAATLAALFSGLAVLQPGIAHVSTPAPSQTQTASVTRQIAPGSPPASVPASSSMPAAPVQVVPVTSSQAPAAAPLVTSQS